MLKGRGRDPRGAGLTPSSVPPAHLHAALQPSMMSHGIRPATPSMQRAPIARPEPDYEVVEFPGDQYVNAKLQPPPPPPPRPPTGHPLDAGASCGLCGGGGARVRCTECGRRALCASCDDMYHRHPKRRHHQRQALSQSQIRDERPPLPPKVAPPVPPPRRHKVGGDRMSASPKPMLDQRRATLNHISGMMGPHVQNSGIPPTNHQAQHIHQQIPLHLQTKITSTPTPNHLGSMPYLPTNVHLAATQSPSQINNLSHMNSNWNRPRGSPQGFALHPNTAVQPELWDNPEHMGSMQNWNRPLRRGASVLELGGGATNTCIGCAHCAPMPWRYGSCASLDHPWAAPNTGWPSVCCTPPHLAHNSHMHQHALVHPPQTPQPYRRGDNRTLSRAPSRAGSRAVSPAMSVRSRTSRRHKHRTPSPPLPSSDADSESESESDHGPPVKHQEKDEESLGPAPPPSNSTWQCEHCTYVNEPGVRVCVICCRTPTTAPQSIIQTQKFNDNMERLKITSKQSPTRASIKKETDVERDKSNTKTKKERTSTGCGPSESNSKLTINRLVTPTRETSVNNRNISQTKHDMAVGPSPPREVQNVIQEHTSQDISTNISPARETNRTLKVSPYKDTPEVAKPEVPTRHSISVGPSPPRENSLSKSVNNSPMNAQKKSTGTSPPRVINGDGRHTIASSKSTVSNTGTSPPPQSISTQTYEVPNNWERASSTSRSRPRRRFRDDSRRERSHSRHSLSSDTRESERSVRTAGPDNRWEWRERDSSPGGDWGDGYNRLSRRASHLDLRRTRSTRRSSVYGSEAPSPERQSSRAISLEALAGAGARREAERGMELAQLMGEAEKLGFSAAEVQAALTQSPAAPLAWLRQRWPSLCAGVRAAAARLAPTAAITELEARAALARHRGAMWPAVTECVERHRRQIEVSSVGEEGKLRGHVWGSPIGADDDAAPPRSPSRHSHRMRAEDSSDEFEAPTLLKLQDDDWMYLPLNINMDEYDREEYHIEKKFIDTNTRKNKENASRKLEILLQEAGAPMTDENMLLKELISENLMSNPVVNIKSQSVDFIQSENDFIDAYNALTRLSPLPNINDNILNIIASKDITENELHVPNKGPILDNSKTTLNLKKKHDERKSQHKRNGKREKSHDKLNNTTQLNNPLVSPENTVHIEQIAFDNQIVKPDIEGKEDEKANNLSDMVNNTQRLIQQMKEEINSDIHSIGGKTSTQSENEISSEESNDEQESSYSDTEDRTDNLTSDEKEMTSSEDEYHDKQVAEEEDLNNQKVMQYRTSSEDNENFEEALDHVETQSDDYKHTNIEILDSITRTLQEEHTLTVDRTKPGQKNVSPPLKKQDRNNNLFVPVNSFDEIYEELSNNNKQINDHLKPVETVKIVTEPNLIRLPIKETIIYSMLKPVTTTKVVIAESKHLISKGKLEIIEDGTINVMPITAQPTVNAVLQNSVSLDNTNADNQTTSTLENTENHMNIDLPPVLEQYNNEDVNNEAHIKQIEVDHMNTIETSMISLQPKSNIQDLNMNLENSRQHVNSQNIKEADLITSNANTVKDTIVQKSSSSNTQKSQTSEKNIVNNTNINIKNHSLIKSSIPKLIKIMPNSKNKIDNHFPKFVVSKVPIRRSSIKQYPAPAPPKNHFSNIQNGHVKQLQSKIFNNKATPSKPVQISSEIVEVKATTSTLNKKKLAPPPPVKQEEKEISPPIPSTSTKKEKNQYFRETCRTEDEWTESDSENSQAHTVKPKEQSPYPPPSPPPPLTLRRVSGQLIDLAKIRISEGTPERQARMLLAEGATETWEQAQLAVELISRGTDAPAALLAALECTDLNSALAYLFQDCELCASRLPEHEMVSMLRCTHRCCRECARLYFTVQITERSIIDCVCPYCKLPELESLPEDAWLEYFAHLDILLKTLLETDVHELFQRKLRDRTLARDPNFRWCMECSSGFFVHPKQKKVRCPECRSVSCAACRKPWNTNHEGLTCEQYTAWLEDNDPERSLTAIQQHLRDNGLECPRCHFKYSLSRGGCMHFTCTQCKYEFCNGCGKPFTMGARCGLSEYCAKLGLHAHHPRNCLFYLRDKEPHELQTLLQMNNVNYETQSTEGSSGRCLVQLQRETPTGLIDGTCGNEAPDNYAGLCKGHYVEYLAGLARGLDPIPIMDVAELVAELRRRALPLPERGPWDTDPIYAGMCAEIVKEKIPLD